MILSEEDFKSIFVEEIVNGVIMEEDFVDEDGGGGLGMIVLEEDEEGEVEEDEGLVL